MARLARFKSKLKAAAITFRLRDGSRRFTISFAPTDGPKFFRVSISNRKYRIKNSVLRLQFGATLLTAQIFCESFDEICRRNDRERENEGKSAT